LETIFIKIILLFAIGFIFYSCGTEEIVNDSFEFNMNSMEILVDQSKQIEVIEIPNGFPRENIEWRSSNDNIAVVDSRGKVKAIDIGTTQIIGEATNGLKQTVNVKVLPLPTSISLDQETLLFVGTESKTLNASVYPQNQALYEVTWTSSDSNILRIDDNGTITPVNPGEAYITASTINGKKATSVVNVAYDPGEYVIDEGEPNDSYETATEIIYSGTTIVGENSLYDLDFFKLTLKAGQPLSITLSPEYSDDLEYYGIGLLNDNDVFIATDSGIDNSFVTLEYEVEVTGTYYILVLYDYENSPYSTGDGYSIWVVWG